jgi:hypothetical protein
MIAIFQKKHRWALWALAAHFVFVAVVFAMEISDIPPAKATEPACADASQYFELQPPLAKTGPFNKSNCDSCKSKIQSAVQKANGVLASANAQNASINASTAAGTASTAAIIPGQQEVTQFGTGNVNSAGQAAATQQQALAQQVATAMDTCASEIEQACSAIAQSDKAMADQAANSCKQSAQQARQVAADKAAKAAEMAKNGQQANQNGQGMQPPQMPQGGAGGSPGLGSSDPTDSKISSNIERAKGIKLDSKIGNGKTEIPNGQSSDSGLSSEANTATTSSGGGNTLGSSDSGKSSNFAESNSGAGNGGGGAGVSSAGAMGSLGSGGTSKSTEEKVEAKTSSEDSSLANAGAGSAGGGSRPTLGLRSSGDELSELLNPSAQEGSTTIGGSNLENLTSNPRNLASNATLGDETSLFKRIKAKITRVTRDQHMQ